LVLTTQKIDLLKTIYPSKKTCQIDIWSEILRKYPNDSYLKGITYIKEEFLGTITVNETDDIQIIRETIRQMIPDPPSKIDLHIIRVQTIRTSQSIKLDPIPPYSELHNDQHHNIKYIIYNTCIKYDYVKKKEVVHWFTLKPLDRVIFKAVDYKE
jgi:hypothetical protein